MADPIPSVGDVLGASGACPTVEACGKVWRVGWPTQRAKACLEELAAAKAVSEVRALKPALPPDAYAELFGELIAGISSGAYRTWGSGWQRVVFGGGNSHLFLLSLLRENHPGATEQEAKDVAAGDPDGVAAALARVVPGFFDVLLRGVPLPPEQMEQARAAARTLAAELLRTPTPATPAG